MLSHESHPPLLCFSDLLPTGMEGELLAKLYVQAIASPLEKQKMATG
jgi:hypothetical protein